mmetsp:Transcript_64178/g.184352  ORF Transcript_64178/g.184352 Transcript_64178/m.184352 type:complete len:98 (+) Transcript_64178:1334-1627(+)
MVLEMASEDHGNDPPTRQHSAARFRAAGDGVLGRRSELPAEDAAEGWLGGDAQVGNGHGTQRPRGSKAVEAAADAVCISMQSGSPHGVAYGLRNCIA